MAESSKVTDISEARTPDWNKIKALYSEGAGDPEIARALNLTMKRFDKLIEDVPAFAEFVEMGRTLSMAWWYEQGRKGITADKFNSPLYSLNMKNRFGWADRVDNTATSNGTPINADQARSDVAKAIKKLAKVYPELLDAANFQKDSDDAVRSDK